MRFRRADPNAPAKPPRSTWARMLTAAIAGAVAVLAFAPFGYWPLQILSLGVLFYQVLRSSSVKGGALIGWAYGFGWCAAGTHWLYISMHRYGDMAAPIAAIAVALLALLSSAIFMLQSPTLLVAALLLGGGVYASLGRGCKTTLRLLRALLIACALLLVFHAVLGQTRVGVVSVARMAAATLLSLALTASTRSGEVQDVLEWLLQPLQRLGLRTDRFALQLALMLRFIGHFFVVWQRLDDTYRLRTGKSGGFRLLAPLTIQMLQTAKRVADTLDVRLGP